MQKLIVPIVAVLCVIGLVAGVLINSSGSDDVATPSQNNSTSTSDQAAQTNNTPEQVANAQYVDYSPEELLGSESETNLLFFHATWCTICNSIERNINAGTLPDGVTIHKVDYDDEVELIKKYDINYQSAFVQVDNEGNQITQWQGLFGDDINDIVGNIESI